MYVPLPLLETSGSVGAVYWLPDSNGPPPGNAVNCPDDPGYGAAGCFGQGGPGAAGCFGQGVGVAGGIKELPTGVASSDTIKFVACNGK